MWRITPPNLWIDSEENGEAWMYNIFYLIGVAVVVLFLLSLLGVA